MLTTRPQTSVSYGTRSDASTSELHDLPIRQARRKVAGYARVSTDLQREKETIRTQIEMIEKYAADQGLDLTEIYADDGVSGTTHLQERPEASRLLQDARAGKFDALVVYKGDRIGRDVLVNEIAVRKLFDKLGIAVLGIAEQIDLATPIGRAMFTFQSAIGRLERENTLRRSKDATLRLAREGVWLGGIVPFGYRVEGKGRSARLRLADEPIEELGYSEVDVVRLMYHLSAEEGKSSIEIARILNELGVPTVYTREGREVIANKRKAATRGEWTRGRVRNMMVETVYYGLHQWGKKTLRRARRKVALNAAQRYPTQRLPTLSTQHGSHAQHEAHRESDGSLIIQRSVPAIVPLEVWQAAQVTMHRNAVARPDLTKRKYLLRGLMKCALCGSTYIGSTRTDSSRKGKRGTVESVGESGNGSGIEIGNGFHGAKPSHEPGAGEVEIQDGQVLRPYYLCNGHQHVKSTGAKCPSAHLRALDIEAMLWNEVEGFLRHPEEVLGELAIKLKQTFEGAGALQVEEELEVMRQEKAAVDDGRASLFRLFRRGAMSEEDLDRQLGEMVEEENALGQKIERLEREVAKARDSHAMLRGADLAPRR